MIATLNLTAAFTQHRGLDKRNQKKEQQDAILINDTVYQDSDLPVSSVNLDSSTGLCAVADGVAISPVPHRASYRVLDALSTGRQSRKDLLQNGWVGPNLIRHYVHPTLCRQVGLINTDSHSSSTTLALLEWREDWLGVLNVGDSRVYRIGSDGSWQRLSKDHTFYQSMLDRGEIAPGQSLGHMYRDLEHVLSADDQEKGFEVHFPQRQRRMLGDTLMLCTDGIHDILGENRMQTLYQSSLSPMEQVTCYRETVLASGAPDNFSLIMLRFGS